MKVPMKRKPYRSLVMSDRVSMGTRLAAWLGQSLLFAITSLSTLAVFFIFYFIAKDAFPFFRLEGFREFFLSTHWYPSGSPAEFGGRAIFIGTGLVTLGAIVVAVPMGVAAAVCLSDLLSFSVRQIVKPVIEILAAIPSVAYGFFALVIFAPLLQERGGTLLGVATWLVLGPILGLGVVIAGELLLARLSRNAKHVALLGWIIFPALGLGTVALLLYLSRAMSGLQIDSGTNAFNVSIILGIMALPTVVSVAEDALQAAGRELREGSYALGATRAETILRCVIPASISGILAAIILGIMRAIGETMVVWMASGNAARVPSPWYNVMQPIRTLTATIAGDMGEADHVTGSSRFHVLFAMAFCLLAISFIMNLISESVIRRSRKKTGKAA